MEWLLNAKELGTCVRVCVLPESVWRLRLVGGQTVKMLGEIVDKGESLKTTSLTPSISLAPVQARNTQHKALKWIYV